MNEENNQEIDFNADDYTSFFYTSEKYIGRMDDNVILAKITEKYPDFTQSKKENVLKQTFIVFLADSKYVKHILDSFDLTIEEFFKVVYRNYYFIFNACFTNKIHNIIKTRSYAKRRINS